MKKGFLFSLLASSLLFAEEGFDLKSLIGKQKQMVLDSKRDYYEDLGSRQETSWISDINLQMASSYTPEDTSSTTYSLSYRQPVYMGGNILNTILSARKQKEINLSIVSKERDQVVYEVLRKVLHIKRMEIRKRTILLSLKAAEINLSRKKELYSDGTLDITFVSDMIIALNDIKNQRIDIDNTIEVLKKELRLFSSVSYEELVVDKGVMSLIKLMPKNEFLDRNYLSIDKNQLSLAGLDRQRAANRFLPTVSLNFNAYDETKRGADFTTSDQNYYGGFNVSVPLSLNNYKDFQVAKVKELMQASAYMDKNLTEGVFYDNKVKEIEVIDKKIKNIEQTVSEYDQLIQILQKDLSLGLGVQYDLTVLKINRDLKVSEKFEQLNLMKEKTLEIVSHTAMGGDL